MDSSTGRKEPTVPASFTSTFVWLVLAKKRVQQLFWEIAEPCFNRFVSWMFFVGFPCFGREPRWGREEYKALQYNSDLLGLSFGYVALCCCFASQAISGCFSVLPSSSWEPVMKRGGCKDAPHPPPLVSWKAWLLIGFSVLMWIWT